MSEHSKRSRRRMRQHGMGGGVQVVHRLPQVARQLPHAPVLTPEMEFRLRCVEYSFRRGVAAEAFGVARATVHRWRTRYHPRDLQRLEDRSRRSFEASCGSDRRARAPGDGK